MTHELLPTIADEFGPFLGRLAALNVHPTGSRYFPEAFGDFYVDFESPRGWLRIVRDRGQYYANGALEESLKSADLWRAHDNQKEFEAKLLAWFARSLTSA